jgi:hypothetical protein
MLWSCAPVEEFVVVVTVSMMAFWLEVEASRSEKSREQCL